MLAGRADVGDQRIRAEAGCSIATRPFEVDSTITVIDARADDAGVPVRTCRDGGRLCAGGVADAPGLGVGLVAAGRASWRSRASISGSHWPSDVVAGALIGLAMRVVRSGRTPTASYAQQN